MPRFETYGENDEYDTTVDVCADCATEFSWESEVGEHPDYDSDDMYVCERCGKRLSEKEDGYL